MDNLTMTRLCAEAMGYAERDDSNDGFVDGIPPQGLCVLDQKAAPIRRVFYFDPLHNDTQAMALVKKMGYEISRRTEGWHVGHDMTWAYDPDLNRAIVEVCAKMELAKKEARNTRGAAALKILAKMQQAKQEGEK